MLGYLFANTIYFEKPIFPRFYWRIFNHVMLLNQSRVSKHGNSGGDERLTNWNFGGQGKMEIEILDWVKKFMLPVLGNGIRDMFWKHPLYLLE